MCAGAQCGQIMCGAADGRAGPASVPWLMNPPPRLLTDPLPECLNGPAEMPRLDPRPMPALMLACPKAHDVAAQGHRMPLWRGIEND